MALAHPQAAGFLVVHTPTNPGRGHPIFLLRPHDRFQAQPEPRLHAEMNLRHTLGVAFGLKGRGVHWISVLPVQQTLVGPLFERASKESATT